MIKVLLGLLLVGLTLGTCQSNKPDMKESNRPNIILIMADDLGYEAIGCYADS